MAGPMTSREHGPEMGQEDPKTGDRGPGARDPRPKGKRKIGVCVVWVALYLSTPQAQKAPQQPRSAQEQAQLL